MSDLSPIDYERSQPGKASGLRFIHYLLIIVIVALLISILIPSPSRNRRGVANQIKCASNLRQIGQGIALYAQDNGGPFPPDLQAVFATEPLGLQVVVCPSSGDVPPSNSSSIATAGACSYIYVGAGLTDKANPECIVALEDPANHGLQGGNVLFADGHVEFVDLPAVQLFLNELNAGRNPPATLTPTLSKAGAEQDYEKNWKPRIPQLKTGVWRIPTTQRATPE